MLPVDDRAHRGRDIVAYILAGSMGLALNVVTIAVLIDAIRSAGPGLSENATQVLTTGFAGFAGLVGGYLGGRAHTRDILEPTPASSTFPRSAVGPARPKEGSTAPGST